MGATLQLLAASWLSLKAAFLGVLRIVLKQGCVKRFSSRGLISKGLYKLYLTVFCSRFLQKDFTTESH